MKIDQLSSTEILEVFTNADSLGKGDKILITLCKNKLILISPFWGYYYECDENAEINLASYRPLKIGRGSISLEKVLTIEGVATYVKLLNGNYIHLFEEIEDMERFAYYNRVVLITPKDSEPLQDLMEDMKEADDMTFEICDNIEKHLV